MSWIAERTGTRIEKRIVSWKGKLVGEGKKTKQIHKRRRQVRIRSFTTSAIEWVLKDGRWKARIQGLAGPYGDLLQNRYPMPQRLQPRYRFCSFTDTSGHSTLDFGAALAMLRRAEVLQVGDSLKALSAVPLPGKAEQHMASARVWHYASSQMV